MKPTKNFNMKKSYKTMLAIFGFKDQSTRDAFKRMMIQAQLSSEVKLKAEPRRQGKNAVEVA